MRYIPANSIVLGNGSGDANNLLPQYHIFSANGVYDPDITGLVSGHQPCGFDQMKYFYNHYTVVAAQIKVQFTNTSSVPQQVFIHIKDDKTKVMDLREVFEGGNCKVARLTGPDSSGCTRTLTYRINPNKFLGISKPLSDKTVKGDVKSNPSEGVFFHVGAVAQRASDPVGPVYANITIEYSVVWTEPKRIGVSLMAADEPHMDEAEEPSTIEDHTHDFNDVTITPGAWGDPDTASGTTEGVNP
jgi:hypothetical protein